MAVKKPTKKSKRSTSKVTVKVTGGAMMRRAVAEMLPKMRAELTRAVAQQVMTRFKTSTPHQPPALTKPRPARAPRNNPR